MQLKQRLCDVMEAVCEGLTNSQIATRLGVTQGTVNAYMQRIFEVYGVRDRDSAKIKYQEDKNGNKD